MSPPSARSRLVALVIIALTSLSANPLPTVGAREVDGDGWEVVSRSDGLTIYNRVRKGAALKEFKAVGIIDASPLVVKRVLDDAEEYPKFMPYVIESRLIERRGNSLVGYQRVSPPIVGDRDYTMRIICETRRAKDGTVTYCNRWESANDLGPAEKSGVARVKTNEGSWTLEPIEDGSKTRATYLIYTDSGGSLPSFVVNAANKTVIPKLFDCVRKQARLEKYSRTAK